LCFVSLDLEKECHRLRKGFKESLKSSLLGIVFKDVLEVQMPEWKKSSFWVVNILLLFRLIYLVV